MLLCCSDIVSAQRNVHLLKILCYFPLLALKGIYHYWNIFCFSRGLKQMEGK